MRAIDHPLAELGAPHALRTAVGDRLLQGRDDAQAGTFADSHWQSVRPRARSAAGAPAVPGPRLPYVVVVADRVGADVDVVGGAGEPEISRTVDGETQYVHKAQAGGSSHLRYHHSTEDVWRRNADRVVDEVTRLARDVGFARRRGDGGGRRLATSPHVPRTRPAETGTLTSAARFALIYLD